VTRKNSWWLYSSERGGKAAILARSCARVAPPSRSSTQRLLNNIDRIRCDFPSTDRPERLTWREIQILRLVARGYNNREVSEALAIAEGTVKNYISGILWKLGVRDRTRAVLKALEAGYL